MPLLPRVPAFVLFLLTIASLLAPAGAGAAGARNNDRPYLVTYAARSCDSYTDVTANRARNNIMESLEDLGADTLYNGGQSISVALEDRGQPNCRPITGWRFTLGTGIAGQDVGAWGRLSKVASPYATSIRTLASVPERNPSGNTIGNRTVAGAVTVQLTDAQAQRAQNGNSLWVQGGIPGDPVLNGQFPNEYGFAALRCSIDNLNGDNVEWIGFPGGQRHAFCYAYYVKPPPTAGTIIVTKSADAYPAGGSDASVAFPFGGTVSYEPGGTFSISTRPGSSASTTFTRGETRPGDEPWVVEERSIDGWSLRDLSCTSSTGTSTVSTAGPRATISLGARDTVRCTYTNTPIATTALVVAKRTLGGTGAFPVTVTPNTTPTQAPITRTLTTKAPDKPVSFDTGFTAPGSYTITEQLPTSSEGEWRLVSATCNGVQRAIKKRSTTVTLVAGQPAPRCELVNEFIPSGSIELYGVAWGGTTTKTFHIQRSNKAKKPRRSVFTATQRAVLTSEGVAVRATGDDTSELPFATYLITELEPISSSGNWELIDVTCTEGSVVDRVSGGVLIRVDAQTPRVQCAFTNRLDLPTEPPVLPPDPVDPDGPEDPVLPPTGPGDGNVDGDLDHGVGGGDPTDGSGPGVGGGLPNGSIETGQKTESLATALAPWTVDEALLQSAPPSLEGRARRRASGATPLLTIPRLGVRTRPYVLGVTRDRRLRVPDRISGTGWWGGGAAPGSRGRSVVVGHVDGPRGTGVFHGLRRLERGDVIRVERAGRRITYRVTSVRTVRKSTLTGAAMFGADRTTRRRSLRLVTCGGSFRDGSRSYDSNVIVDAVAL
jgi:LPXTG-site transpeptidase (sortase) family protein